MTKNLKEYNRKLISRYFDEILTAGRLETIDELMHPAFIFRIPDIPQDIRGIDSYKDFVRRVHTAFPDAVFTPERIIAEETRAAARWTFSGTHQGPFLGVAPTHRAVTDQGIDIFHFADDLISNIWASEDPFGILKQLGAIPADVG